ncbi:glycosyltransferase [Dyella humi]|uniref:Glycosyltransferase family 4 protein n=1 Tax=Dyella humi TaxID=1770547 RepID=A0ABW8IM38_9GAMM
MKLLLDLQGAQSQSRSRGIGRYTLALTRAFLDKAEANHDARLLLNARFGDATDALIATLGKHANPDRRLVLDVPEGIRAQPGGNDWLRRAAARTMRHAVEGLGVNVVWYSSVLEGYNDDAVLPDEPPAGVVSVATLYDLIPLHDPDAYLDHPRVRQWYEQGIETLRRCNLLFAISEWVRQDAIKQLGLAPERVINIGAAVDSCFAPSSPDSVASASLRSKYGITRSFVLYNGGFDPRKNVPALIRAFGALSESLRAAHQLVVVGRAGQEDMAQLQAAMQSARLTADDVIYTGYAPDGDLIRLYGECALFVFPSLLEGFGLPPLEAMACGAPVIASHAASLPEVVGRRDALFDPQRVDGITVRMTDILGNPSFAEELRRYGRDRAAKFNWSAVADRALNALQMSAEQARTRHAAKEAPASRKLVCVPAPGTAIPSWMNDIEASVFSDISQVRNLDAAYLLYVAELGNASTFEKAMRMHPGVLLVQHVSRGKPAADHQDRWHATYKGMGYPGLLALQSSQAANASINLAPLFEHALAVLCADESLAGQIRASVTAMSPPDIRVLPESKTAPACLAALKQLYATHPLAREAMLLNDVGAMEGKPSDDDLAAVASTAISVRKPGKIRRWLVDVSSIAEKDLRTGVHRVVRNTLVHWLKSPPDGVRIEPVRFSQGRYHYARRYALDLLGLTDVSLPEEAVEAANGDTFFGLDWAVDTITAAEPQLREWHRRGVSLQFLIYDLLPITLPDTFHPYARDRFKNWLKTITTLADRLICVSRATAEDLSRWLALTKMPYQFKRAPGVEHSPPGVDATLGGVVSKPRPQLVYVMRTRPTFLMVGTIEPRKGYDQALDAFELLWSSGIDVNLVIIGRFGWMMEAFVAKVDKHAERDRRLFWIDNADDGELNAIYQASTGLLAASWGEGYGLPLIEAARRGLPVIARDLPVFREVMGQQAAYFNAPAAADLAEFLRNWLITPLRPNQAAATQWPSWQQSAANLAELVRRAQ